MAGNKIYVAGERGMVGTSLIRHLKELSLDVVSTNSDMLDLRDRAATERFFSAARPDRVVLVAAHHSGIGAYQSRPAEYLEDNMLICSNVIDCCCRFNVKRLVNIGASCVYKNAPGELLREEEYDRQMVQKPTEPYGLAKLYGMKLCEYYNLEKGTEFVSLLPTNLYGDGVGYRIDESSVIPAMLRRFHMAQKAGKSSVEIWGDGKAHREFLHVRDFAKAVSMLLLAQDLPYTMYNVGSGISLTINELAGLVAQTVGYKGKIVNDLSKPNGADRGILDSSRLRQMGWAPEIPLAQGLQELYANLVSQGAL